MKKFNLKSMVVGVVIGTMLSSVALAANWTSINVVLNQFRIRTGTSDVVKWGDTYTLNNGSQTAGSIVYNDTTYLPIRKIAEATGMQVDWNSDSNTVTVWGGQGTGIGYAYKTATDANGTLWNYNIMSSGGKWYLHINDDPQNARTYEIAGPGAYLFDSTGVTFITYGGSQSVNGSKQNPYAGYVYYNVNRILFNNDANSQDGTTLYTIKTQSTQDYIEKAYFLDSNTLIYLAGYDSGTGYVNERICKYNLSSGTETTLISDSANKTDYDIVDLTNSTLTYTQTVTPDGLNQTKTEWTVDVNTMGTPTQVPISN